MYENILAASGLSVLLLSVEIILLYQTKSVVSLANITFDHSGAIYVPLYGTCKYQKEEAADYMLRSEGQLTQIKLENIAKRFVEHVRARGGEICDLTKGLRCNYRVITPKDSLDLEELLRRSHDEVDPDGGGNPVTGLKGLQNAVLLNVTLTVLSTCRCSVLDSLPFAGRCLVRAGMPCQFDRQIFPNRKCVQNADCSGGISNLDSDFVGFTLWPSYYELLKYSAVKTCECQLGYTISSGRECLRGGSWTIYPRVPMEFLIFVGVLTFNCYKFVSL